MIQAKIIADSITSAANRLTTFEVEFHRFILPELNTHRVFSRNYQSSRAVPIAKLIEQVIHDPALPVYWGKNQPGMEASEEDANWNDAGRGGDQWRDAAVNAAVSATEMLDSGYHKQIVNRLLEPFMWTRGVITATQEGMESFFALRCHPAAQPEIRALAEEMRTVYNQSEPVLLEQGEWHTPYFGDGYWRKGNKFELQNAIKIATSCVAQVSYRRLDDSLEKAHKIYDMLNLPEDGAYKEDPPHFSPAEHCAMAITDRAESWSSGNFNTKGWYQYRKMLEKGRKYYALSN